MTNSSHNFSALKFREKNIIYVRLPFLVKEGQNKSAQTSAFGAKTYILVKVHQVVSI